MPIYEYFCPDNNRIYQFFAKTVAQGETTPKCPDDPNFRMIKMVSSFAIQGAVRKSVGANPAGASGSAEQGDEGGAPAADDPRMEAAMAQMEAEMGSIDENDPRAMGRIMRRMSELTGEPLEGEMEEMVRKLEEGQDPEAIEAEMGDMLGDDPEGGGMGGGFGGAPSRDPNLYDY